MATLTGIFVIGPLPRDLATRLAARGLEVEIDGLEGHLHVAVPFGDDHEPLATELSRDLGATVFRFGAQSTSAAYQIIEYSSGTVVAEAWSFDSDRWDFTAPRAWQATLTGVPDFEQVQDLVGGWWNAATAFAQRPKKRGWFQKLFRRPRQFVSY